MALGKNTIASGLNSMSIGSFSSALSGNAIVVGLSSVASGVDSLAFGVFALANGVNAIAIGRTTSVHSNSIGIGFKAITTAPAQLVINFNDGFAVNRNIYLGNGVVDDITVYPALTMQPTGAAGTNISAAGALFIIAGAKGTGTGAGGDIIFQTAPSGITGSAQNILTERMRITSMGSVGINTLPVVTAILDIVSTTKGVLFPRLTNTQRDAIVTAATSLFIYNSTTNKYNFFNGTVWEAITSVPVA
mgnify:CR=1 FL=1